MPTALEAIELALTVRARMKNALADGQAIAEINAVGFGWTPATPLTSGTAADQADRVLFKADETISAAGTLTLNMRTGANWDGQDADEDLLGTTLDVPEIVALLIENDASSAGELVIGGEGTANAWDSPFGGDSAAVVGIKPGGVLFLFAPTNPAYLVGAADTNLLLLSAVGGDVTFRAVALGRSA